MYYIIFFFLYLSIIFLYSGMGCKDIQEQSLILKKSHTLLTSKFNTHVKKTVKGKTNETLTSLLTKETSQQDHSDPLHNESINYLNIELPDYVRGIYLSNNTVRIPEKLNYFINKAKEHNINSFVIDVQPKMINTDIMHQIKQNNIFSIARVVVFEGGLKTRYPTKKHMDKIYKAIKEAALNGFEEVQLDYIRYADRLKIGLSTQKRYEVIRGILKKARSIADKWGVYISADIFGRITLNHNDEIGQKLEYFAEKLHTLYPMLYPSHYTNDIKRISQPYHTIKEGIEKSQPRVNDTRLVAYVQGFDMKISYSKLSLTNYIKKQLQACKDSNSHGWVIWNARNKYQASFDAIQQLDNSTVSTQLNKQ